MSHRINKKSSYDKCKDAKPCHPSHNEALENKKKIERDYTESTSDDDTFSTSSRTSIDSQKSAGNELTPFESKTEEIFEQTTSEDSDNVSTTSSSTNYGRNTLVRRPIAGGNLNTPKSQPAVPFQNFLENVNKLRNAASKKTFEKDLYYEEMLDKYDVKADAAAFKEMQNRFLNKNLGRAKKQLPQKLEKVVTSESRKESTEESKAQKQKVQLLWERAKDAQRKHNEVMKMKNENASKTGKPKVDLDLVHRLVESASKTVIDPFKGDGTVPSAVNEQYACNHIHYVE